jgi:2-(1,2-epoxy-1,2-dihydrophenyl)acetyl-CoA isomerase
MNRPQARNALNMALVVQMRRAVRAAAEDGSLRAVVLTGRGPAFCAGADVREWADKAAGENPYPDLNWVDETIKLVQEIHRLPKPVIAMIDGAAVGAGLDMALACDFRIASERSKFICSYTNVGYPPDCGGTWLMPRVMGIEAAKRFAYTGELWTADVALANRLVGQMVPQDRLVDETMALARRLAAGPTVAIGLAKRLMDTSHARSLPDQMLEEQAAGKFCAPTRDHAEGLAAANERRAPQFVGA